MPAGLRLELVTQENVRAACKLELRPDQEGLVAPVAWSLADDYTMPDIAWPRLVYAGDQLVGFIMAAFAVGHENPLFHSYLWRLAIGAEHQGKGYGRFAVGGNSIMYEEVDDGRRGLAEVSKDFHSTLLANCGAQTPGEESR
jgi:diamine N-acetyltransferase